MRLATVLILALSGMPLFAVMAISAMISHHREGIDQQAVMISFYRLTDMPLLTSLPLFAFGGYLLANSHAPQRLLGCGILGDDLLGAGERVLRAVETRVVYPGDGGVAGYPSRIGSLGNVVGRASGDYQCDDGNACQDSTHDLPLPP